MQGSRSQYAPVIFTRCLWSLDLAEESGASTGQAENEVWRASGAAPKGN